MIPRAHKKIKVLNLYAGIGGNRKLWENVDVTAVEYDPAIADMYSRFYPEDIVVVADAHEYLLYHHSKFDFIWSSPPCQTHSRLNTVLSEKDPHYPDMKLYEEILLLRRFYKGKWVVENVIPFYKRLIPAAQVGRHLIWSNYAIPYTKEIEQKGIVKADIASLEKYHGIKLDVGKGFKIDAQRKRQILRNCVHPEAGLKIFNAAFERTGKLF